MTWKILVANPVFFLLALLILFLYAFCVGVETSNNYGEPQFDKIVPRVKRMFPWILLFSYLIMVYKEIYNLVH